MAEITIASYNKAVSPAFTGATATLKIWYDRQFLTSDDEIVLAGSVEYPNLEVACTVSGGGFTVTIPQFVIDSTIDGIPPNSRATAILFDADGIHRETVLANFRIPDEPTSTTWPALFIYNQGGLVTLPEEFYNKNEVNALLATVIGGGGGGTNTIGMSNLGNTSGTTGVVSAASLQYLFAGGNNITLSQSLNGSSGTITISAFNQSVQPIGTQTLGMSNIGNTSGDSAIRSGTGMQLVFAGGNNITLSQSTNGSSATITISAFTQSAESQSLGISNLGNTSGTTGIASGNSIQYLLAGGNNITLSQSLDGNKGTVTISAFNQSNQSLGAYAVSNTTQSSSGTIDARSLSFQGAGIASVGVSNGSVVVSVPASGGAAGTNTLGMSNLGNTSGDTSIRTGSAIQLVFAGGNNVTLSQSTNGSSATVTVSAANQTNQTLGLYAVSNTTQSSSGTVDARTLSVQGAGVASVGVSNGSLIVSVPAGGGGAGTNTLGMSNIGNTSGDTSIRTGSAIQLVFAGGNNVTLSQSTNGSSATVTISAFNQSVQPIGTNTLGMSNIGNTSGDSAIRTGTGMQVVFAGGNNVTLSQSTNGSSATVTISAFNQSVQPIGTNTLGMSNIGNTAGDTAIRSGTGMQIVFAGGNNITLSQSTNGSSATVTVSAFNQTAESNTFGMSNLGNTSGTSGVVSAGQVRFLFAGGNNVTLSQSLNGASGTVTISAFNQSVQPIGTVSMGMSNLGNTSGTTGIVSDTSPRFLFAGGNNVTLSQSLNGASGTITISAFNQSVQPIGTNTLGMSNIGNTSGDTSIRTGTGIQLVFAGGNNVTLSQSTNGSSATITVSAFNQTNQSLGLYAVSNTTQSTSGTVDARTLSFQGAGGASIGVSNGSVIISAPTGGAAGTNTIGMSNIGNTSGDTSIRTGTGMQIVFAGGNNITLSQSTNGSSATITMSAFNQSNQSLGLYAVGNTTQSSSGTVDARTLSFQGAGNVSVGVSNGSVVVSGGTAAASPVNFSAGTTSNNLGSVVFTNSNNISFGLSGSTISASFNPINVGVSTGGNTSGTTGTMDGGGAQLVFVGGNNITLSQSSAASAMTITMSAPATSSLSAVGNLTITPNASTISLSVGQTTYFSRGFGKQLVWAQSSSSLGQNSVHIYPEIVDEYLAGSVIKVPVMLTASSSAAAAQTRGYTMDFGVYTRHATNSTVLTRHYSTSYTASVSQNSNGTFNIGIITGVGNSTSYNTLSASSAGLNLSASIHGARELILPWATTLAPGEYWFALRQSSSSAGVAGAGWNISHIIGSSQTQNQMGVSINSTDNGIAQQIGFGVYSATSGALPAGISMTQIKQSALAVPIFFMSRTN